MMQSAVMSREQEYRGRVIDAEVDEGGLFRPVVDGDFVGDASNTFVTAREALEAAKVNVHRRDGAPPRSASTWEIEVDGEEPEWVRDLRDAIR